MTATLPETTAANPAADDLKKGVHWERVFSPTPDPYATIDFELDDIVLSKPDGTVVHEDLGILFPKFWQRHAREITSQHYLRGPLGSDAREKSIAQMINRVVDTVREWGLVGREVADPARQITLPPVFDSVASADAFAADLKFLLVTQKANFNSPVWYNIGVPDVPQQPSACFILRVDDTIESIYEWYRTEGVIFKGGSGSGTNLSRIRSSYEGLSKGGWASGPVSYMCGADAAAGTMKSGGRSRRAAKMVVLDVDHPDIYQQSTGAPGFIPAKKRGEEVNRTLRDNGFDVRVDSGHDSIHVQFQNANNSVRVNNAFMESVLSDTDWQTVPRSAYINSPVPKYKATFLWDEIAKAAWECADPGLQFDTTVNFYNSKPAAGRINASNPCSEYMDLDESPCNLAATNLLLFLREDGSWDAEQYVKAVEIVAIAQTILAAYGDYPLATVHRVATSFRQIGQGYTNLGALLMKLGIAYDSDEGRAWDATITAMMQGALYATSARIAAVWGAYPGLPDEGKPGYDHPDNKKAHDRIAVLTREYAKAIARPPTAQAKRWSIKFGDEIHIETFHREVVGSGEPVKADPHLAAAHKAAVAMWDVAIALGSQFGWANAHMSVLAPMGTNGIMMDQDTSGIEPGLALKVLKKKVSGDHMNIVVKVARDALVSLGYDEDQIEEIVAYIDQHASVVNAPHVSEEHYSVFDTALSEPVGDRFISGQGHLLMMAAAQPFISGAISKTVNLPNDTTVEEVKGIYWDAWRLGLKALAIFRDGCKATQPMTAAGKEKASLSGPPPAVRHKLPRRADARRIKLRIEDPAYGEFEMYVLYSKYPDGSFGEIFEIAGAEGSFVNGLLSMVAKTMSAAVQHGTPLKDVLKLYLNMNFPPAMKMISPSESDFTSCTSVADLLARELALECLSTEDRHDLGVFTRYERAEMVNGNGHAPEPAAEPSAEIVAAVAETAEVPKQRRRLVLADRPICFKCSVPMEPNAVCWVCPQCGGTTGCS